MEERLGPSRLDEILRPFILGGVLLGTFSVAGLALSYDEPRATTTIQIVFGVLFFPSLFALFPYLSSIVAQGVGATSFPLVGVRVAAAGCAGIAILIGLALSRPVGVVEGLLGIAGALGLIAIQFRSRWGRSRGT